MSPELDAQRKWLLSLLDSGSRKYNFDKTKLIGPHLDQVDMSFVAAGIPDEQERIRISDLLPVSDEIGYVFEADDAEDGNGENRLNNVSAQMRRIMEEAVCDVARKAEALKNISVALPEIDTAGDVSAGMEKVREALTGVSVEIPEMETVNDEPSEAKIITEGLNGIRVGIAVPEKPVVTVHGEFKPHGDLIGTAVEETLRGFELNKQYETVFTIEVTGIEAPELLMKPETSPVDASPVKTKLDPQQIGKKIDEELLKNVRQPEAGAPVDSDIKVQLSAAPEISVPARINADPIKLDPVDVAIRQMLPETIAVPEPRIGIRNVSVKLRENRIKLEDIDATQPDVKAFFYTELKGETVEVKMPDLTAFTHPWSNYETENSNERF